MSEEHEVRDEPEEVVQTPELTEALQAVVAALKGLPPHQQKRVLQAAAILVGIEVPKR